MDKDKILYNLEYLASQNAPESDVQAYLQSEGVTLDMLGGGSKPGAEPGFQFSEMAGNIPGSAKALGMNLVNAIAHPVDTAQAINTLGGGVFAKILPGVQSNEAALDPLIDAYKGRYGSAEAALDTIESDPVGVLADASAALTAGGGLLSQGPGVIGKAGKAVATVGKATDPVNLVANTAKTVAGKVIPKSVAAKMYESAAKWRPAISAKKRAAMTQTALDEGLMPTGAGVSKASMIVDELQKQIDSIIDTAAASNTPIPADVVFRNIDEARNAVGGFKVNAARDVKTIDQLERALRLHLKSTGKKTVTARELQDWKVDAYNQIDFDMKQGKASYAGNEFNRATARAAREELEKIDPRIAELNKREGALLDLLAPQGDSKVGELTRAANRIDNYNLMGLLPTLHTGVGAQVGGLPGALLGAVTGSLTRPKAVAAGALYLNKLQNQGLLNYLDNSTIGLLTRQGAIQSERGGLLQSAD